MRYLRKLGVLLLLAAFVGVSTASADVDKDKDKKKAAQKSADGRVLLSKAVDVGDCNLGSASADLDVNNVRARTYNNGGLFWRGSGNVYTVPKEGNANAIFASGIWIGGLVNGALRFAGTDYGPWEFWPGPLDANGNPPADCSQYDRIFNVYADDISQWQQGGEPTADMVDWPGDLGAPFVDVNGDGQYSLQDGDYPEVLGHQTQWWVMNDAGNTKTGSATDPIGLEVQVTAFAFRTADALNNTTFYRYKLIYKGDQPLENTYFGIWSDPDLGDAVSDFVGSDTTLGMAFVYNGTDIDAGVDGYGNTPPALGYDYFQGPLIPAPGETHVDPDGTVHEDSTRIQMSKFIYYNNDSSVNGNPSFDTDDVYNYLRGVWRDGTVMTFGGNGYGGSEPTDFMFPGDPVNREYWSEENTNGAGARNTPADRRFLMSSGPFTMQPGDVQEIVYGIVFSRAQNRLGSVAQLRFDDILAQGAYNFNFQLPPPPDEPRVTAEPLDGAVAISWTNPPNSNNYLNAYDQESAFLIDQDPEDGNTTYTFEGYKIYQYSSPSDNEGQVIATLDIANNVTQIVDEALDPVTGAVITQLVANGTDSGVRNYYVVDGLTNFREYTFGVQAYAYNPNSAPKIYASPINRFTIQPAPAAAREGGTRARSEIGDMVAAERLEGSGESLGITARVVDPLAVTGDEYEVRVYTASLNDTTEVLTYDIVNATEGTVELNGQQFINRNGKNVPFGQDVVVIDGLSFSVDGPPAGVKAFLTVSNANGPLDPPDQGAYAFNANGFPTPDGESAHCSDDTVINYANCNDRPSQEQQVGDGRFGINVGGGDGSFESYLDRSIFGRAGNAEVVGSDDYEWRFNGGVSATYRAFDDGVIMEVPFEIWNIGTATPDDPSDDYRMIPLICEEGCGGGTESLKFDFGGDHPVSGGEDDAQSDWIYWYNPVNTEPGDAGYQEFAAGLENGEVILGHEVLARQVLIAFNAGTAPPYPQDMPEVGTVFRIVTNKPLADGDRFVLRTSEISPETGLPEVAESAVEEIGIVPNPYKGASAYEVDAATDEVRFTNLPDKATIRVFTLSGDLIRTMNLSTFNNKWDLTTQEGLPIASGMYLIHVETDAGEKVIKFGVVKKRIQLDLF